MNVFLNLAVHRVVNNGLGSILSSSLQSAVLDGIFKIGRLQLSDIFLNVKNPIGSSRLAKLRHIFDEGKSLQLQFPAEDLGFRFYFSNSMSALLFVFFIPVGDAVNSRFI